MSTLLNLDSKSFDKGEVFSKIPHCKRPIVIMVSQKNLYPYIILYFSNLEILE